MKEYQLVIQTADGAFYSMPPVDDRYIGALEEARDALERAYISFTFTVREITK